ncbi:MAG: 3-isopropylmalate dehydratase small subunit [Candidatus Latescibacterota bacterium]|nr:3-isopropylmalate dehydratase small subunit [Candidatus Latescibacterota bacterium]
MATTSTDRIRSKVQGRAVPVRGADIDTDRIIPARYLRTVTFDNLGEHAFEDDRAGGGHPFDDERFQGASVLLANANFGCGSSREHAPQALMRWGLHAFVAESFAEIFFGNCIALGLPCFVVSAVDAARLQDAIEVDPNLMLTCDVGGQQVRFGQQVVEAKIPEGPREQFLKGTWDALGQLLEDKEAIAKTAQSLPYVGGTWRKIRT